MSTTTIKLFIFFVLIIKIVNCGNCCGTPQVYEGNNGNAVVYNPGNENDVDDDESEDSLAGINVGNLPNFEAEDLLDDDDEDEEDEQVINLITQ
ncbi:unnamed protein product [Meloidogyne enterolobii]|uniref:Uncharacterized protein n=1 Tax=Meloidogyne enterolobii TaxID=390850 RepID=A0ACB0Z6D0_MELEN